MVALHAWAKQSGADTESSDDVNKGCLMKQSEKKQQVARNVDKALADVPIDNKQERDMIRARLRQKYAELEPLKAGMREEDRQKVEELGDLLDLLEACESRPPDTRS
jgi:hypothetical protein